MAPHSSTLAWKIPWTEEPGRLQSMWWQRVRHDWGNSLSLFTCMHWRRKWQPTPVFLPGESQGWGNLVGCRLWGRTESDTTEATQQQQRNSIINIAWDHHLFNHTQNHIKWVLEYKIRELKPVFYSGVIEEFCFVVFVLSQRIWYQFSSVQSLSRVWLFATPWIAARQTSLSITNSQSSLRLTSIESMSPSSHLILCRPLLLLPPIPPSIRVFSNESTLRMRWPKSQGWFLSEWTGGISLQSRGLSRIFSNTTVQKHQFFGTHPSSQSNSHIQTWPQEKP